MQNRRHLIKIAFLGAVVLALSVFGVAFATIYDTAVVSNFTIDFLGVTDVGGGVSQWTYAITEPLVNTPAGGLSHWTLGIQPCGYEIVKPLPGTTFTTINNVVECADGTYDCQVADYLVEQNDFGTVPGLYGIKFNFSSGDALNGGDPPHTHVFRFQLSTPSGNYLVGDTDVLVKTGGGADAFGMGLIQGPVCPPNAVNVVSLDAGSSQYVTTMGLVAFLAVALMGGGAYAFSRRQS